MIGDGKHQCSFNARKRGLCALHLAARVGELESLLREKEMTAPVNAWRIGKDNQIKVTMVVEEGGYTVLIFETDGSFNVIDIDEAKQLHALLGKILSEG